MVRYIVKMVMEVEPATTEYPPSVLLSQTVTVTAKDEEVLRKLVNQEVDVFIKQFYYGVRDDKV